MCRLQIIVFQLLLGFTSQTNNGLHWSQRLAVAVVRTRRTTFPAEQLTRKFRKISTGRAIKIYCSKLNIAYKEVALKDSSTKAQTEPCLHVPQPTLHFVTPPSASETGPILLYFHGGGYVNPLQAPGHMPFALRCAAACKAKEVVFLEFSLAPEHPYPSQLVQAVAPLRYLLNELSLRADDIIIAGDSAGGNLTGSRHPYAAPLDLAGRQLEAVLFVSPWVILGTDQGSYRTNHGRDFLTLAQENWFKARWNANGIANEEEVWANLREGEGATDVWNGVFPSSGESQGLVKKAMVTVGTAEVLLDSCRLFARNCVKAETVVAQRETDWSVFHGKDFVFAECEGAVHIQPALDVAVKYYEGYMMQAALSRLKAYDV
ncbi:hypothetical protein PAAG_01276 [Paracoccidioides lutzii Pb01]|uniref:Alpha/beta hydrolase fold-3 domain-containing protein n=1 Tax=Paracoccidioides lutzii (strain ATCC MYA-826 / Pb01) TaxID=502779 RepID=C1GRY1_PARBA|nr:hypothetical protein PAAG_01276 [Paracoccidioides lutzii Pb01]EEH38355.2 hypothetical protein PAAG_01276 [Paracoccidioides lutzii Pb01]